MTGNGRAAPLQGEAGRFLVVLLWMPVTLDFRTILSSFDSPLAGVTRLTSVTITSSWNVPLSVGFFSEALVLARVLDEGGIAIWRAGGKGGEFWDIPVGIRTDTRS